MIGDKYHEARVIWYISNYEANYKSIKCPCGGRVAFYTRTQHSKSKRHNRYLINLKILNLVIFLLLVEICPYLFPHR